MNTLHMVLTYDVRTTYVRRCVVFALSAAEVCIDFWIDKIKNQQRAKTYFIAQKKNIKYNAVYERP